MRLTRTACSYCGVGCGIEVQTTTDPDAGRPVIARVSGDKLHPTNFGRLCTKGATHAEMMRADDGRLKSALLRPDARRRTGADARRRRGRRGRPAAAGHRRRARPRRRRAVRLRADVASRPSTWRPSSPRDSCGPMHIESNSRLCMASAGTGYKQSLGADGPPGFLHRLRPHRPVLRHRLEHGRLPSDPVPADGRPAQGGRQADRRRPAAHHHRREGRPVPADQARHRSRAAQRPAASAGRERRHRRRVHRRAHRGLGRDARVPRGLSARRGSPRSPASPKPTSAPPQR